jgi:PBP1b-binding outer membrane lipoprotein LpoB
MKRIGLLLTALFVFGISYSQTIEDSVKHAVNQLFEGMKSSDEMLIRSAFADSAILQSVSVNRDGKTVIENDAVSDFANQISKIAKGSADEQIVIESIKIDGPLAMVWAPYKFYFNGKFSHCGVDSFQLVRINGQWKIQFLIDTRRRQPCN